MSVADNVSILEALTAAIEQARPVVLATVVDTSRSVPRHAGTKMLVYGDGKTLGTVGGGGMEAKVIAEAGQVLRTGRPAFLEYTLVNPAKGDPGICGGEVRLYLEPYMPPHTVYVIGCGHVGRKVVELAHWLGFRTIAVDDRPEAIDDLPGADVGFVGSVADAIAAHPIPEDASLIVVTRSPDLDVELLPHLVEAPARYIGVMGSETRWRATRKRLIDEQGVDPVLLDRLHVPIGIDLNAETLEEIAVSILGEVIRNNRAEAD